MTMGVLPGSLLFGSVAGEPTAINLQDELLLNVAQWGILTLFGAWQNLDFIHILAPNVLIFAPKTHFCG